MRFIYRLFSVISAVLIFNTVITTEIYSQSGDVVWKFISENEVESVGVREIIPAKYKTAELNISRFLDIINQAPKEFTTEAKNSDLKLKLPMPDGTFLTFLIYNSPVMAPELAAKYPSIRTFSGKGIEDKSAYARFDFTLFGFHAWIRTSKGTIYIDPHNRNNILHYISYYKKDAVMNPANEDGFEACAFSPTHEETEYIENLNKHADFDQNRIFSGENLRTYRLANACTGEYAAYHGGTVPSALAAIVTAINRVTGVYETEVAIRMELVANNDLIVYTNSSTDPYSNNNGSLMLGQNQTTCDNIIGAANYDIGHVFSTGGGGIAGLGVVCRAGNKARGVTGLPAPTGDPFYIDYVAHEMGHQFGANHPFNGNASSCSGGNRNASTAYEPGSGSTIMAYAGICGAQNLQQHSDDYFHVISLQEIINYSASGSGNGCPTITASGNTPPTADAGTGGKTVPISTPLQLTGSATDPNGGDVLTYCWEEFDLGPAGAPASPSGDAPIFRSFDPKESPTRVFPKDTNLVNNTSTIGEILPTYARNLKFRLTVRDNQSTGGVDWDQVNYTVTDAAGPFVVQVPSSSGISWQGNTVHTVTWSVANTNNAPVSCSSVNILLSTDGGYNFDEVLVSGTTNDGSQDVLIPDLPTSQARIKVEAANNIFFDISNMNFEITPAVPVELSSFTADIQKNGVQLKWTTATEVNNSGFYIERRGSETEFSQIYFVKGKGTTSEKSDYSYFDKSAKSGKYFYRLKQVDFDGAYEYSSAIEADLGIPQDFILEQNHPNPFNPETIIKFSLPVEAKVNLKVYNVIGQEMMTLSEGNFGAGQHELIFNASSLPSGIYFYSLIAAGSNGSSFKATKKMIVMK